MTQTTWVGKYLRMSPSQRLTWARALQPGAALTAIEHVQRGVDAEFFSRQRHVDGVVRIGAEHEAPATEAIVFTQGHRPTLQNVRQNRQDTGDARGVQVVGRGSGAGRRHGRFTEPFHPLAHGAAFGRGEIREGPAQEVPS